MFVQNQFSCFLIGEGTLPIQCAELILERGHQILGIISPDASLSHWAKGKSVPHIQPIDNIIEFLSQKPFDYLFSIVNNTVLSKDILELPRKYAINYHDALLPKYAGVNATSWALRHREKTHGVTWHVMSNLVDGGDILKQLTLDIADDETTFTLNGKCYETAIHSFAQLIDELSCGQELVSQQNLDERTYFPRYKRPPTGGIFSLNSCAYDIDAFIRSLNFGPYPNPLGLPKLVIGNEFIIVPDIEVLNSTPKTPSGTITRIDSNSIKVYTASSEILIRKVLTIEGQSLPIPDCVARFGLHEGYRFKDVDREMAKRITKCNASICKHEAFWIKKLARLQPIRLPYANLTASHVKPVQFASVGLPIPDEITTFLADDHQAGWSISDFLLAAFGAYIVRIGGICCFDIGFREVELQRDLAGLERFFAQHVPLRVDVGYDQSFEDVFHAVLEQVELVRRHKTYARDVMARYPLLRSTSELWSEQKLSVIVERVERLDNYKAMPDSEFTFVISADGTKCRWVYNAKVLDRDCVARMQRQFNTFLQDITKAPDRRIADLSLLTQEKRHHILAEFNDTDTDYPQNQCIHDMFEAQVERTPDAIAVVFEDEHLTYGELNHRANQLAHHLHKLGVGPEVLVGICVERSLEMVVGVLGILKVGGAYVPLDPTYPKERLSFMLEDSQVLVLLTQEKLRERLPVIKAQVLCLDTDWTNISRNSKGNIVNRVQPDNLAFVIYTSGTTGKPKGVMNLHRGLCNLVNAQIPTFNVQHDSRIPQFASFSFDASIWEIVLALCSGASLYMGTQYSLLPGKALSQFLHKHAITHLVIVPSALAVLPFDELPALQTLIVGGEAVSANLVTQWSKGRRFFHSYGPTEATISVSIAECSDSNRKPHIGQPIANTKIYILDHYLQPVPICIPGELHIGGVCLARGYLNRPDLTAEKFIPNPFSNDPDSRLYKTGDLARYLPDGNIEFLGRFDNQVKIRGFRIELGEIEAVLGHHPAVQENVVIVHESELGDKRLVAYIVSNQRQDATPSELRQFIKEKLPDYMVPSAFVMLEALPLTPNGKVDRRVLPAPKPTRRELDEDFVPPSTPTEEVLTTLWTDILGLEQVGIYDNFFELGGHSLLATQLISRVRDTFSIEIPLRHLFESPTCASLAAQIESTRFATSNVPPIEVISREEKLPLSFAQQRLWFLDQLEGKSATYNIPMALRLTGSLYLTALEKSLTEIVQRHESLRTCFPMVDGSPVQVINPALHIPLVVRDLQHLPGKEKTTVTQRLVSEEAQRPFDLANGSLLRTTLWKLGEEEHVLLLNMHHIISDDWSIGIFFNELSKLYKAFSQGKPSPLPALPIQYADFAHWQRQWLSGEVLEKQLNYWKQQIAGAPPLLELPTDWPRPPVQRFRGATEPLQITPELTEQLKTLSQQTGTTLFMTLLSAFATLLSRYSGQTDIVIGSPIANRTHSQIESLIGFFVNTLVLRLCLSGNLRFDELLRRVRRVALDAYAHQDIPFEQVVEELQPERNLSYSPLIQVMFVLQNAPTDALQLSELTITPIVLENVTAKFDITLFMEETTQRLKGTLEYNTDLFEKATITRMVGHFQTLLEGIVKKPQQSIAELPLLTEIEYRQLMAWNDTATDYPKDKCIHQLFEAQVETTPDAVALVFEAQQLNYRDLNSKANQVAHYLQTLGVKPEVLVAICIERSLEMVIGLLGILKAGGAYLPLDPAYPRARLAFMLEDAQVPVLLTKEKLVENLPDHQAQVVCLDTFSTTLSQISTDNPVSDVKSANLAYVMYTSGSTGQPKGISVIHRGVVRLVKETNYVNLTADEVFLQLAPISFDASTFEIWGSMLNGAKLIVMPPHTPSLENLGRIIEQYQVTTLWLTASLFHLMVDERLKDLKPVHQLLAGGEVLSVPHVRKALQELKQCQLINGYGPTENTTFTCCCSITESKIATSVPIGRPIANSQVYLLDAHLQPVPVGVPGELHIGGAGLARGYLNRPDLTAEKFIPNPFSYNPDSRLYKTGDLARYLPDGNIEYLGRLDHQVKIRGFRIELGEIEVVLTQHPIVRECVVIVHIEASHDKRLVAYLVPKLGQLIDNIELRDFLTDRLPDYMIPSAFVQMETMPLTPNGKIDRRALPVPEQVSQEQTFVAPRNTLEQQLTKIWEKVLKIQPIGVHDNFFDLGGNSMLAMTLLSRIEKHLGKSLSLVTLFQAQTIAQHADIIRQKGWSKPWTSLVPVQRSGTKPPFFCVPPAAATAYSFVKLARYLGTDQPVYGLQPLGLEEGQVPHNRVEDMAAYYIKEIRSFQPSGPYYLGGMCFGGNIAFEIAQQLQAQDCTVALLALFDPSTPCPATRIQYLNAFEKIGYHFKYGQLTHALMDFFVYRRYRWLKRIISPQESRIQCVMDAHQAAVMKYIPQVYPGKITLFRSSQFHTMEKEGFWARRWSEFATGKFDCHVIQGNHKEILLGSQFHVLTKQLKLCLDEAQQNVSNVHRP